MEGEGVIVELKAVSPNVSCASVGKASTVSKSTDKAELVIYGRNGMRLVRHPELRSMLK